MEDNIANTLATLEIDGFKKRNVLEYNYSFNQSTDKDNQPAGIPRGGKLTLKLDACTDKGNIELLTWLIERNKKEVKITVKKPSAPTEDLKILIFKDAFCVDYKEVWKDMRDSKGDSANTEDIVVTWREFHVDKKGIFINEWS